MKQKAVWLSLFFSLSLILSMVGGKDSCPRGFVFQEEMQRCVDPHCENCQHVCYKSQCYCLPGFYYHQNSGSCKPQSSYSSLFSSSSNTLSSFSSSPTLYLMSKNAVILIPFTNFSGFHPILSKEYFNNLAVDSKNHKLYLSCNNKHSITRYADDERKMTVFSKNFFDIRDLKLDWVGENLYINDKHGKRLSVCSLKTLECRVLYFVDEFDFQKSQNHKQLMFNPHKSFISSVDLDPKNGLMYWLECRGDSFMIKSSLMSGGKVLRMHSYRHQKKDIKTLIKNLVSKNKRILNHKNIISQVETYFANFPYSKSSQPLVCPKQLVINDDHFWLTDGFRIYKISVFEPEKIFAYQHMFNFISSFQVVDEFLFISSSLSINSLTSDFSETPQHSSFLSIIHKSSKSLKGSLKFNIPTSIEKILFTSNSLQKNEDDRCNHSKCKGLCLLKGEEEECACREDKKVDEKGKCVENWDLPFYLVTDGQKVKKIHTLSVGLQSHNTLLQLKQNTDNSNDIIQNNDVSIIQLANIWKEKKLFLVEYDKKEQKSYILLASLLDLHKISIIHEIQGRIPAISVDWMSGNVYFVKPNSNNLIVIATRDKSFTSKEISLNFTYPILPHSITINAQQGIIYISNSHNNKSEIYSCDTIGQKCSAFFNPPNQSGSLSHLTFYNDSLFWTNKKNIYKLNIFTLLMQKIGQILNPSGLGVSGREVVSSSFSSGHLEIENNHHHTKLETDLHQVTSITFFNSLSQPNFSMKDLHNFCAIENGGCSHLCLSSSQYIECSCPSHLDKDYSKKKCLPSSRTFMEPNQMGSVSSNRYQVRPQSCPSNFCPPKIQCVLDEERHFKCLCPPDMAGPHCLDKPTSNTAATVILIFIFVFFLLGLVLFTIIFSFRAKKLMNEGKKLDRRTVQNLVNPKNMFSKDWKQTNYNQENESKINNGANFGEEDESNGYDKKLFTQKEEKGKIGNGFYNINNKNKQNEQELQQQNKKGISLIDY